MIRFIKYIAVTLPTFLFDLSLLVGLKSIGFNYILAAGVAFICATTANYLLSRRFVFIGTKRSVSTGYIYFLSIASIGLLTVTFSMWLLVGVLHLNYIISRVGIALAEGMWNYLMNLYFNFKVVRKVTS